MNEGDRSIVVFPSAIDAARAALDLHDRVASESFPPGIVVRLQAAVAVGEPSLADGVYGGAIIDQVLRLRALAGPGTTVVPEPTAELLVELVGDELSLVPLPGDSTTRGGAALFALTRPGDESRVARSATPMLASIHPHMAPQGVRAPKRSRWSIAVAAMEHPLTLGTLLFVGLTTVYALILAPEFDTGAVSSALLAISGAMLLCSLGWQYVRGSQRLRTELDDLARAEAAEEQEIVAARDRAELRLRLQRGFDALDSTSGREGSRTLQALSEEFEGVDEVLRRSGKRPARPLPAVLEHLAEEAYRNGMSALSDSLELLESSEGAGRRRLERELSDIETRLASACDADPRSRDRDEQRRFSHRRLLSRHDESRQRALELMFEAERCTSALAETRLELASVRSGDTQLDVEAVVQTLQHTICRVREVQEEFRRLSH
jgi:hypothetical protein